MPTYEERLGAVGAASADLLDKPLEDALERRFSHEETVSPFLTRAGPELREDATAIHEERSRESRTADESFNAPAAKSYRQWIEHPNRYDMPGVDTIPPERMLARAERTLRTAELGGAVDEVVEEPLDMGTSGSFNVMEKRVSVDPEGGFGGLSASNESVFGGEQYPREMKGFSLAHEVGHAIDAKFAGRGSPFWSSDAIVPDEDDAEVISGTRIIEAEPGTLAHEAKQISARMRGEFEDVGSSYRASAEELTADVVASVIIEPRAARRESPELARKVKEELFNPLRKRADIRGRNPG